MKEDRSWASVGTAAPQSGNARAITALAVFGPATQVRRQRLDNTIYHDETLAAMERQNQALLAELQLTPLQCEQRAAWQQQQAAWEAQQCFNAQVAAAKSARNAKAQARIEEVKGWGTKSGRETTKQKIKCAFGSNEVP